MKKLEKTLKAFANITRLKILKYLKAHKTASVSEIATATKSSYKATSKHLAILYQNNIVDREQAGYEMLYNIQHQSDEEIAGILKLL